MSTLHLMQLVCGQANKVGLSFGAMLYNDLSKLRVTYSFELTKWISVTVSGPDEELAADLLTKKYGKLHLPYFFVSRSAASSSSGPDTVTEIHFVSSKE